MQNPRTHIFRLLLLLALAACQPQPAPEAETHRAAWPAFDYAAAAQGGAAVYRLDLATSRVEIVVRRAGPLARLGHDHVIVASPEAWIYWPENAGDARAELRLALDQFEVDPADARQRYGLEDVPDAAAIEGTRRNMLEKVLAAETWPYVTVDTGRLSGGPDEWELDAEFTVRDHRLRRTIPVNIMRTDDSLAVQGSLVVEHAELGLEPYTALAGAIRVAEAIELHFALNATRVRP